MKLLVDMNLSPRWADELRRHGYVAAHWSAFGPPDAADTVIMAYARLNDFVVLTHDLDFGAILAATNWERPSVVQLRADDNSPEAIGTIVLTALRQTELDLAAGALVTVEPARMRVRILPLNQSGP